MSSILTSKCTIHYPTELEIINRGLTTEVLACPKCVAGVANKDFDERDSIEDRLAKALRAAIKQAKLELIDELIQVLPDTILYGSSIRVKERIREYGYIDGVRDSKLAIQEIRERINNVQ